MPKYLIERTIPNAATFSPKELSEMSAKFCRVLRELGQQVQWVQSFVTDHRLFCVYLAPSVALIREHALRAALPIDSVREVKTIIDPTTAE